MDVLRRIAIKHNHIPSSVKALAKSLVGHGRIYEIDDFVEEERQDLGLPVLSSTDKKFLEVLAKKIASKTPNVLRSE